MGHRLLESYNDITKEYICFSRLTGEQVFNGVVGSFKQRKEILDAVRLAEDIACNYTKSKAIKHLEVM